MFRNSIFAKLLLSFLLLSTIPLMLSGLFLLKGSERTLNEKLQRETTNILDQKLKTLSFFIADMRRMGDAIALDKDVSEFIIAPDAAAGQALIPELNRLLSATQAIRPENIGMTLINDRGLIHAYGYELRPDATPQSDFHWLSASEDKADLYTISQMHDRSYSAREPTQPVFSFIRNIGNPESGARGVLIIDFKIEMLRDLLKNIFLMGDIYNDYASGVIITDRAGEILYPYPAGLFVDEDYKRLEQNYFLIQRYDKTTDWNFTAYFLKSELYKPIYGIRQIALSITIGSIIICVIASLIFSDRISKPILQLRNLMMKVGRGDFDVHYKGKSQDEIGALGHGFNTMVRRIQDLVLQVYEEQDQKRRAEVTAMQSQINPHFLYNTLESINSLARKTKQREISRMIVLLGKLLRMSISTFEDMIPIEKEVAYVRQYLEIHKLRMKEDFRYDIQLDPQLLQLYTIKWILQPVIENAVIHGLYPKQHAGNIEVKGWLGGEDVYISVSDQGVGMEAKALLQLNEDLEHRAIELAKHHGKVGLFNVQSRIKLYFGPNYGIHVESVGGQGMTVIFKLPRKEST
ncbi:sensor histidine kinase [Paenibacillus alkaliterrae]|uniref:cache domain-containing sensor histidine kinase n=1 Tax=Paenibacillus alkaliterrae TaxID=320909 RepID=UPI001F473F07|nr:sensor histidine kinase [Paenibacillus alkaliterrae]MCF2941020.1 sensor histidine kinase [Paenibacillus alkaliterrae]